MSQFSNQLSWAAKTAQKVIAPLADPTASGVFTLAGYTNQLTNDGNFTGTMSIFEKALVATPNGYEEQRQIKIAATVTQFASIPDAAARPRIYARGLNWTLTAVEPGAQFYVFTGVVA